MSGNWKLSALTEVERRGKRAGKYLLQIPRERRKKKKKVGFTGPDNDKQKCDPIAESVDTLLEHSKMVFYATAIADRSFLTVLSI